VKDDERSSEYLLSELEGRIKMKVRIDSGAFGLEAEMFCEPAKLEIGTCRYEVMARRRTLKVKVRMKVL
jgi:hypothetical protein